MSNVGLAKGGRHCAANNCSNGDIMDLKNGHKQYVLDMDVFNGVMIVIVFHHMNYITFQHE